MKRTLISILGFVGLFTVWGLAVSIVFIVAEDPTFLPPGDAWLRLWWEAAPFLITAVLAVVVARLMRTSLPGAERPMLAAVLGGLGGAIWLGLACAVLWFIGAITFAGPETVCDG